jgi:hypothetical protein
MKHPARHEEGRIEEAEEELRRRKVWRLDSA